MTRAAPASIADVALVAAGVATAGVSIAFAAAMLASNSGEPRVNGLQYLAIFAQPNGASKPGSGGAEGEQAAALAERSVDRAPTGSIRRVEAAAPRSDEGVQIIGGRADLVWVRRGTTVVAVRPGDVVPGIGRVASIVRRGDGWAVLDASGAALVASGASAPIGKQPGRLARSLIFD